ncbi:MAG: GGDEF domain-containing protein [Eubacteriales bacterium]
MKKEKRKGNLIWVLIAILAVIFGMMSFQINDLMTIQNDIVSDLSEVEYLSSSTQRLTLMVVTNHKDNRVSYYIDEQTSKFLNVESNEKLSVLSNPEIAAMAEQVIINWNALNALYELPVDDEEASYDVDSILLASNNHFNSMTDLSLAISAETDMLNGEIETLQLYSYIVLAIIAFCIINYIVYSSIILKRSNEMAAIASVDIATGLYNRSKCQELFKDTYTTGREQQPAVVVIDLNDLKKTNDIQGHRVGDELISSFASILKEAVNVHSIKPFLGRYGGDEFVVYHKDIEKEDEILAFLKELDYLSSEFNKNVNKKFSISYAVGYAINTDGKDGLGTRQLFDEADECMYTNKKQMKKALELHENEVNKTET